MEKIPTLFTDEKSNYNYDDRFDPWPVGRNALEFIGEKAIIAHPPCRLFSRMRSFSTAPGRERFLAYYAIGLVRRNGGIVEHPRSSTLWKQCQVGTPLNPDHYGGYVIHVHLHWFGFPAQKKTCLYIVGIPYSKLPPFPISFDAITHTVSTSKRSSLHEISKNSRSKTPLLMLDYLFQVIQAIEKAKNKS